MRVARDDQYNYYETMKNGKVIKQKTKRKFGTRGPKVKEISFDIKTKVKSDYAKNIPKKYITMSYGVSLYQINKILSE